MFLKSRMSSHESAAQKSQLIRCRQAIATFTSITNRKTNGERSNGRTISKEDLAKIITTEIEAAESWSAGDGRATG